MNPQPKKNSLEFYSNLIPGKTVRKGNKSVSLCKREYRWRIMRKGRVIAASTEGYSRLAGAENNVISIVQYLVGFAHQNAMQEIKSAATLFKSRKK